MSSILYTIVSEKKWKDDVYHCFSEDSEGYCVLLF